MKKLIRNAVALALVALFSFSCGTQAFAAESADAVTRGEFVAAMNTAFGLYNVVGKAEKFTDIEIGDADYFDLMAAKEAGVFKGYQDGTALPDNPITRIEAAAMLKTLLKLEMLPTDDAPVATDAAYIPAWAFGCDRAVVAAGLMSNDNGAFRPNDAVTEEELSAIQAAVQAFPGRGGHSEELKEIPSFDEHIIKGKLSVPNGTENIDKLVIFVHGTGANTYDLNRDNLEYGARFRVIDLYAEGYYQNGTAFFSYNTRGVSIGEGTSPLQADAVIDEDGYRGYTPQNSAHDLTYMINALKADPRLKDAKVFLLGASEGTIIAPLAVTEYGAKADALLLAGYCNENMNDVLKYQLGGEMSLFSYTQLFNVVGQDQITKEQFEADPNGLLETTFAGVTFEDLDANADGVLSLPDFQTMMQPVLDGLFTAVEKSDDQWIKDNMSTMMPELLTTWFQAHAVLPKNEDTMTGVDIPIYIFQGTYDLNCPVQGTYDVEARFKELGKDNLTVYIYEGYSHDLNANQEIISGDSKAFDDMFEVVRTFE
jgi:alpha-beta hydrolase superfamily lysophospholipase